MHTINDALHSDTQKSLLRLYYPTMITAHAGAEDTLPNTPESLRMMLSSGADAVEVDLRKHEGILCLSHDEPVSSQSCTTLQAAFDLLKAAPGVMMNIDVKSSGLIEDILILARENDLADRLLLTGDVGSDDLEMIRNNEIPLWMNNYILPLLEWGNPVKAAQKRGFSIVNIDKRRLTDKMLQEQADRFSVWTVDDEETLRSLLQAKVKNITTRKPALALRLREEIQETLKPQ
ncbi:MAG: glycerophosphodiester phosphodiesterase [Clostridiales bacterium]|nr:glycerophosphodiester phosphodiesterase [Clostridiales bacterium]